ncbi:MAG TPA: enoyl-CoA hydratase/isomerase family protein [Aliidongia sp.]|uniref:enoyl-CoA hydratase/isomerase family protein n=1 Tax=Aliidongia sp. TaxID=1914230 RepID=UPI002DDD1022|nr:enoyl-CoA hydratase/isomerase family protein [Aliidongia sp.]HEV2677387.1 enoyl-CoA hydratase/isomerase family protein [Aliidongia sp.]
MSELVGDTNVAVSWDGSIARLTLTRADKLNPLDWATVRELKAAIAALEARSDVYAVIVTGRGRSFSAGGDLDGYIELYRHPDRFTGFLDDFFRMLCAIEASSKIYIAAINGVCVAGGLELLLACDLVVATASAKIGDGHLNFGQLPGAGGSQRLPRAVGLLRAKHLMLTGDLLTAEQAQAIGLVNEVVPDGELEPAVTALAARLGEKSRAGLRGAKHLANLTLTTDLETGLRQEIDFVHRYATTEPDATEGLVAFKEKRKPVFSS